MPRPDGEMRNPFRSESDAFRILVMFMLAAGAVIAAAELVGSWLGVVLALIAIAVGAYAAIGWLRVGLGEADEPDPVEPEAGVRQVEPDGSDDAAPRA
jgi:hypothetical protein